MNLNQKIQSFLTKYKSKNRRRYATALLSVLIVLAVVSSLIMPAVSMTLDMAVGLRSASSAVNENAILLTGEGASKQPNGPWHRFQWSDIQSGSITDKNETVSNVWTSGFDPSTNGGLGKISFEYDLNEVANGDVTKENPTIYIALSDNIKVPDKFLTDSWVGYITDKEYYKESKGLYAGEYVFVEETQDDGTKKYYIVITYYDAYLDYVGAGKIDADITFEAEIGDDGTDDGFNTIMVGDYVYDLGRDYGFTVAKSKTYERGEGPGSNDKINYLIDVYSAEGSGQEETTLTFSDTMTGGSEYFTGYENLVITPYTINESNEKIYGDPITGYTTGGPSASFTVEGLPALDVKSGYEVTYSALLDKDATRGMSVLSGVSNTVTVSTDEPNVPSVSDTDNDPISLNYGIKKQGTIITQNGVRMIQWTITVQNPISRSLDNVTLSEFYNSDTETGFDISNLNLISMTVKDSDRHDANSFTIYSGFDSYLTYADNNGDIVLTDITNNGTNGPAANNSRISEAVFTYLTEIPEDARYSDTDSTIGNRVDLTKSDDGNINISATDDVTYNPNYSISKSNSIDWDNGEIDWKVNISNPDGWNINGFLIEDSMLNGAVNVKAVDAANNEISGTHSGSTWQITQDTTATYVTLTYSTPMDTSKFYTNEEVTESNAATLKNSDPDTTYDTKTSEAKYKPTFTIDKNGTANLSDGKIQWTLTVYNPQKVNLKDFVINDPMLAKASNIQVSDGVTGTHSGTTWTVNADSKVQQFTVTYETAIDADTLFKNTQTNVDNTAALNKGDVEFSKDQHTVSYQPNFGLDKSGTPDYENTEIDWTITITNTDKIDLNGRSVTDAAFTAGMNAVVKAGDTTLTAGTDYTITDGKLTFNSARKEGSIVITYSAKVTDDTATADKNELLTSTSVSNTVKLEEAAEKQTSVTWDANCSIGKNGTAQYADGKIKWTVTLSNPKGLDLNGEMITDQMLGSAKDLTVTADGKQLSAGDYTHNGTNLTLNGTRTEKQIVITYYTEVTNTQGSGSYSNTASWDGVGSANTSAGWNPGFGVSKNGSQDYGNGTITWTITVNNPNAIDISNLPITDSRLTADMTVSVKAGGTTLTQNTDYTVSDGQLTFKEGTARKETSFVITYITKVTDQKYAQHTESNSASLGTVANGGTTVDWNPQYTILKDGGNAVAYNGSYVFPWTITVQSSNGQNLNGFTITDETANHGFSNAVSGTLVVTDGTNTLTSGTDYVLNGNVITLKKDVTNVVVTYKTPVESDKLSAGHTVNNTATLKDPNGENPKSDPGTGTYSSGYNISKIVTGGKSSDNKDWNFAWKITVRNDNSYNLNGCYVEDAAFRADLAVTVKSGSSTLTQGTDYTITDGKLTFIRDLTDTEIVITYDTSVNTVPDDQNRQSIYEDYSDANTATLKTGDTPLDDASATASYTPEYSLSKEVSNYSNVDEIISWKITVNNNKGMSLEGFQVKDAFFANATSAGITVTSNGTALDSSKYTYADGVITFGDITNTQIVITFTNEIGDVMTSGSSVVKNTAELWKPNDDEPWKDASAQQTHSTRDTLTKTRAYGSETKSSAGYLIPWEINIGQAAGGFYELSYTDTMAADNSGKHYMTKEQAEAIAVTYNSNTSNVLDSSMYTMQWYVDGSWVETSALTDASQITQFRITFISRDADTSSLLRDVADVKISYTTTGDFKDVPSNGTVKFTNTVDKDNDDTLPSASQEYSYTKPQAYVKYDANNWDQYHAWSYNDSNFTNPDGVDYSQDQTYLESELETDSDGNYLIKWHIKVNGGIYGTDEDIVLTDTLPEGLALDESGLYPVHIREQVTIDIEHDGWTEQQTVWQIKETKNLNIGFCFKNSPDNLFKEERYTEYYEDYTAWEDGYGYSVEDQDVIFKIPGSVHQGKEFYIDYTAKISPDDLEALFAKTEGEAGLGSAAFANTITDGVYGDEKHTITVDESVIGKTGSQGAAGNNTNTVFYTLDFNKESADLDPNSDYITLEDILYSDDMYISKVEGSGQTRSDYVVDWFVKDGFAADLVNFAIYEVDEDGNKTKIDNYTVSIDYDTDKALNQGGYDYAAKLTMKVPDGKHLKIEYSYHISRYYEDGYYNNGIPIYNNVKVSTSLVTQDTTSQDQYWLDQKSNATATTGGSTRSLQLAKKDAQTYEGLEGAEFNLYAYHNNYGGWLLLNGYTVSNDRKTLTLNFSHTEGEETKYYTCVGVVSGNSIVWTWSTAETGTDTAHVFTTESNGSVEIPDIPDGVIFKAVEVTVPEGYMKTADATYFYYGNTKGTHGYPETEGITSSSNNASNPPLWNIILGESLAIGNEKINMGTLEAGKTWADSDTVNHSNDQVTLELLRSHTPPQGDDGTSGSNVTGTIAGYSNSTYSYSYNLNKQELTVQVDNIDADEYSFMKSNVSIPGVTLDWTGVTMKVYDSSGNELTLSASNNWGANGYNNDWDSIGFKSDVDTTFKMVIQFANNSSEEEEESAYDKFGIPTDAEKVTTAMVTDIENPKTITGTEKATWENLPSKDNEGDWYYYIKEVSYQLSGKDAVDTTDSTTDDYIPSYTGNGSVYDTMSGTMKSITVSNSPLIDLEVNKKWMKSDGTEDASNTTEVKLELYRYTADDKSDAELVTYNEADEFTTSGKTYTFENLYPTSDSGKLYHYYVKETNVSDGYSTTYSLNNGTAVSDAAKIDATASGTLTITNSPRKGSVSAQKKWLDTEGNLSLEGPSGASVQLELWRSTTSPPGRYTQTVNGLTYGNNSITIAGETITGLNSAKIKSITVNADTSLFAENCAKTASVLNQTIDFSSGKGTYTFDTPSQTLTSPLTLNSDSASAVTSIVIDFENGERVTITNTAPAQAEKPAGKFEYCDIPTGPDTYVYFNDDFGTYKNVKSVDVIATSNTIATGKLGFKLVNNTSNNQVDFNGGYIPFNNVTANSKLIDGATKYVYSINADSDTQKVNAYGVYIGLWDNNLKSQIEKFVITFTDDTTFTIIDGTEPVASSVNLLSDIPILTSSGVSAQSEEEISVDDGIPSGAVQVADTVITLDGTADENGEISKWKAQWEDLPYADASGNPYYYYVKEISTGGKVFAGYDSNGQLVRENEDSLTDDIVVINESAELPDTASLTVSKTWKDGNSSSRPASVTVTLYRTTSAVTSLGDLTDEQKVTQDGIENPVTLSSSNSWEYSWSGLKRYADEEKTTPYYYYVVEASPGDDYTVSYTGNEFKADTATSSSIGITNSKSGSITVNKVWNGLQAGSVEFEVYRMLKNTVTAPEPLNIVALGDSITNGTYGGLVPSTSVYPVQLEQILEGNHANTTIVQYDYKNVEVIKQGADTTQIPNFETRLGDITEDTEVVCVLGGTNDIHQDNAQTPIATIKSRLESLFAAIKKKNPDVIIIFGSIPHFDFVTTDSNENWTHTTGATWWNGFNDNNSTQAALQAFEDTCNKRIDDCNTLIKTLADADENIYFADVCAAVDKDTMLADGCHPNANGYQAIAQTYAAVIDDIYSTSPTNTTSEPPAKAELATDVGTNGVIELTSADNWSKTLNVPLMDADGNEYIYYIKEKPLDGYTAEYSGNGQPADGSGSAMTVTNTKEIEKTSISVEKVWRDGTGTGRPTSIDLTLKRKIEGGEYSTVGTQSVTGNGSTWTYTWSNLDKTDENGNEYLYIVEESNVPDGYAVSYQNNDGINENTASAPIQVINTKLISLKVKKSWSDGSHTSGSIKVLLKRSTTAPTGIPLILQLSAESVSVQKDKTVTVIANNAIESVSCSNSNVSATLSDDKKTITISGLALGEATVTVSDGVTTKTIAVTVTDKPTLTLTAEPNTNTMLAGNTIQLTAKLGEDDVSGVTYTSSAASVATVNNNGLVTGTGYGSTKITATYEKDGETYTAEYTVSVTLPDYSLSASSNTVEIGSTITVTPSPSDYATFTYSSGDSGIATVDPITGVVTGVSEGTVTITAKRNDDKTANVTIHVTKPQLKITNTDTTIPLGGTLQLNTNPTGAKFESSNDSVATVDANGLVTVADSAAVGDEVIITASKDGYVSDTITLNVIAGKYEVTVDEPFTLDNDNTTKSITDIESGKVVESITIRPNTAILSTSGKYVQIHVAGFNGSTQVVQKYVGDYNWNVSEVVVEVNSVLTEIRLIKNNGDSIPLLGYTITYASTSVSSVSADTAVYAMPMLLQAAAETTGEVGPAENNVTPTFVDDQVTLEISNTTSWEKVLTELPAYDANGNPYYYWIEEEAVSGYTPSYSFDDGDSTGIDSDTSIDAVNPGNGIMTVHNTKQEDEGVTMPSTGGRGVTGYYYTGGALILLSVLAGSNRIRRRVKDTRMK